MDGPTNKEAIDEAVRLRIADQLKQAREIVDKVLGGDTRAQDGALLGAVLQVLAVSQAKAHSS